MRLVPSNGGVRACVRVRGGAGARARERERERKREGRGGEGAKSMGKYILLRSWETGRAALAQQAQRAFVVPHARPQSREREREREEEEG